MQFSGAAWQELGERQLVRAIYLARMAIAYDPTWADGYRALGLAYLRKDKSALARRTYEEGALAASEDWPIMSSLGDLEWELGRYREAEAAYRRALDLAPQHRDVRQLAVNLGQAISRQGRLDEAATLLERERRQGVEYVPLLLALGEMRLRQQRDADAGAIFREAIARDPMVAQAHYDLGYALQRLGDRQGAVAEIRRAIELDPNQPDYRTALAQLEGRVQPSGQ